MAMREFEWPEQATRLDVTIGDVRAKRYELPVKVAEQIPPVVLEVGERFSKIADKVEHAFQLQKVHHYYSEPIPTESELQDMANLNPAVLDQYTYVRLTNGKPTTRLFHEVFPQTTGRIAQSFRGVHKGFRIQDWYRYNLPPFERTDSLADAFETDRWKEADIEWLTTPWNGPLIVHAGPLETQLDTLSRKGAYQMVVGIADAKASEWVEDTARTALSLQRRRPAPKIGARVLHLLANAGMSAEGRYNAQTLPNDPEIKDEYGARILLYDNEFLNTYSSLARIVGEIFDEGDVARHQDKLQDAAYLWLVLHEASHPLNHTKGQEQRLGAIFNAFDEAHCDISALHLASLLRQDHRINDDKFAAIFMIHMARKYKDIYEDEIGESSVASIYARGSHVELSFYDTMSPFLSDSGKIKLSEDLLASIVNNNETLLRIFDHYGDSPVVDGREVDQFFKKYGQGNNPQFTGERLYILHNTNSNNIAHIVA